MEAYILDDNLRRVEVVDRYESLIWTERWADKGDFQMDIRSTPAVRKLFDIENKQVRLAINKSNRVMCVENTEDKDDSEGRSVLTLTGRSLEATFLEMRQTRSPSTTGAAVTSAWTITDTPAKIARAIFDAVCVNNTAYPADKLPFYTAGTLPGTTATNIAEPSDLITRDIDFDSVFNAIKQICDEYGLGFRITRGPDTQKLYFNVYTGTDRTTQQTLYPAVVFSPDLDNLTNTSKLVSMETFKNIAYVFAPNGSKVVAPATIPDVTQLTGFDRRILQVKADDITAAAGTTLNNLLIERGLAELYKNRSLIAVDGEVVKTRDNGGYIYGKDYNLGDLVEIRNEDGEVERMRVMEQIFVDDSNGEKAYPTLAADLYIPPASWYGWDSNATWNSFADDVTVNWNSLPV